MNKLVDDNIMSYEDFCSKILLIDSRVRYAAIFHRTGELFAGGIRDGLSSYLNENEIADSIKQAVERWKSRMKYATKTGTPEWAMAKYGKIYRITIPLGGDDLILVHTELDANPLEILEKITQLKKEFE